MVFYPCVKCHKHVRPRQHAISCDNCGRWQHRTCQTGVSLAAYQSAVKNGDSLAFICRPCTDRIPARDDDEVEVADESSQTEQNDQVDYGNFTMLSSSSVTDQRENREMNMEVDSSTEEHSQNDTYSSEFSVTVTAVPTDLVPTDVAYINVGDGVAPLHSPVFDSTHTEDLQNRLSTDTEPGDALSLQQLNFSSDSEDSQSDISLNASFNFVETADTGDVIEEQPEILERSVGDETLSTSVVEETPVSYHYFEHGSKRGGRLLVTSDGFTYNVKKEFKKSTLWSCSVRSKTIRCHVTVTEIGGQFHFGKNSKHVHSGDLGALSKVRCSVQVKEEAGRHMFHSAAEIVNMAMSAHTRVDQPQLPKPGLLARAANRYRASKRPDPPKDLSFTIDTDYLQCEDFLIADIRNDSSRHILFATETQLRLLKSCKRWFMDGTFKIVPHPFRQGQLFSIHGFILHDGCAKQVPLAFVLMSKRRKEDYLLVFRKLKELLVSPEVEGFVMDFEAASWLAVGEIFPEATIKGCVFHWSKAVWAKVQAVGLTASETQFTSTSDA